MDGAPPAQVVLNRVLRQQPLPMIKKQQTKTTLSAESSFYHVMSTEGKDQVEIHSHPSILKRVDQ